MAQKTDIVISGAGPAGLAAAAAFGSAGFHVTLVDPSPPVTDAADPLADLRTTAILQPGAGLLNRAGVWPLLEPHAAPLQTMRIVDAGGGGSAPRMAHDFDAAEISDRPFGWNFPNLLLRRALLDRLAALPNVDFRSGTGTTGALARDAEIRVALGDGTRLSARLLVAADGRDSPVRRALGIQVTTLHYGQAALSFAVSHPVPHGGVSTEIHRSGGPFTLVPLPDRDGKPCSAVVWMDHAPDQQRRAALDDTAFAAEATERSGWLFGPLAPLSRRQFWPILTQYAHRMTGPRTALMAEAAHVLPPIGAQGLNTSLGDLALLLNLATANPADVGSPRMLDTYHRRRHPQVMARVLGIDALNRASMAGSQPLRALRALTLDALHGATPTRRGLMRLGLGGS